MAGSPGNSNMFHFLRKCQTIPQRLHHFTSPPAVREGFSSSTSLPTLLVSIFVNYSHPG